MNVIEKPSATEASRALAQAIALDLASAIGARGAATLVLSGGNSPVPMFAALCDAPLDWSRVTVTLADERQVPPDSPLSNQRLVREHLLVGNAARANFVPLDESGAADGIERPFDVVVLGMGLDGHIASLFPTARPSSDDTPSILAVTPDPLPSAAPVARWTWSLGALAGAHHIYLQQHGDAKRVVFDRALASGEWPIADLVARTSERLTVYQSA